MVSDRDFVFHKHINKSGFVSVFFESFIYYMKNDHFKTITSILYMKNGGGGEGKGMLLNIVFHETTHDTHTRY